MNYLETDHVRLNDDFSKIIYLDQTKLPSTEVWKETDELEAMYQAIYLLEIRGAPCIGVFAAYCYYIRAKKIAQDADALDFETALKKEMDYLNSSRPTAVNLSWALNRMSCFMTAFLERESIRKIDKSNIDRLISALCEEAIAIHEEDIEMCRRIGEYGLSVVKDGDGILTHCNAGKLATTRYGTALAPILLGKEKGIHFKVYADETRPLLQGARLTAYELYHAGVDVTLICDNMASLVMKKGEIQACFVGCDRVAANGDAANKIGTSGVAILAKHYNIPFYVLGPLSTIDLNCPTGEQIVIEERDPEEIKTMHYVRPMAPEGVKCFNPAFDVTDHELITAIITDQGVLYPPFTESIADAFRKKEKEKAK